MNTQRKRLLFAIFGVLVISFALFLLMPRALYPAYWRHFSSSQVTADSRPVNAEIFLGERKKLILLDRELNRYFLIDYEKEKIYLLNRSNVRLFGQDLRTKFPLEGANIDTAKFDYDAKPVFEKDQISFNTSARRRLTININWTA